jgi:hypothetical protein
MPHVRMRLLVNKKINKIALLKIFSSKKVTLLWKTILNAIFITRSVVLFFVSVLQKVLFSIVYLIFFEEKLSNNAILFIYFRGNC